jgi:glutaredoxin 3
VKPNYVIYSTPVCKYCGMAKRMLAARGFTYEEHDARDEDIRSALRRVGLNTVPQIYEILADGTSKHIGGFEDLKSYFGIE